LTGLSIGVHVSNHEPTPAALATARAADRAGADTIWISEDLYFHGALPLAGAIAVQTSTAKIGFSVLTPYGMHAGRLAMELATLADLAPGRIIAGLGAGVRPRTDHMRSEWTNPVERVRTYAEAIQTLLDGGTLDSEDPITPADGLALSLGRPPGRLPLYAAAVGPKALTQAGRLFDGVLLSLMAAPPHLETARRLVGQGARDVGRPAPAVVASVPVRIDHGDGSALIRAKELVGYFMCRWAPTSSLRALFTRDGMLDERRFRTLVDQLQGGARPKDVIPDELALAHCAAGTISDVTEQLLALAATGIDAVSLDLGPLTSEQDAHSILSELIDHVHTSTSTFQPATLT
jgi:alkanesulfonate monooxygenase SsuD/methylene tetrahydromethanopterin reductase-like flavin-dependent oxidoreductase (luciferase family)